MTLRDWLILGCERGHDWQQIGGRNAACHSGLCCCSVPVFKCSRCPACDYGENEEAKQIVADCTERFGPPETRV